MKKLCAALIICFGLPALAGAECMPAADQLRAEQAAIEAEARALNSGAGNYPVEIQNNQALNPASGTLVLTPGADEPYELELNLAVPTQAASATDCY